MIPEHVTRAALAEVGRGDLASLVSTKPSGLVVMHGCSRTPDHEIAARALLMAHLADGHHAHLEHDDPDGLASIRCDDCPWRWRIA